MGNADSLLVVEDDPTIRRSLTRWIRQTSPLNVVEVETVRDGLDALKSGPVGAIVDVRLPDGDGLDLVQTIKERSPTTSILVTTASDDASYANRAHLLGVALARKPEIHANILVFLNSLATNQNVSRVDQALANLAAIAGLSRQQRRIVEMMARGTKRSELAGALGVEETTVRTHVRTIIRRVGVDNVDRVAWKILSLMDAHRESMH
jgi:DNA-binding NarL/FixJ family response regulator